MFSDWFKWLLKLIKRNRDARLLLLGLDAAGKTSILYKLKLNELVTTIPTIGFNVEEVKYKNLTMRVWDIGGQDRIRSLWRHYFRGTDGLIFVVDSNDPDRLSEAREELQKLLFEDELRNTSVLIYANKQDLPRALGPAQIAEKLGLATLRHKWHIQGASAQTGEGLYEGLNWLADNLPEQKSR
mmetsp:Transcript_46063/g.108566  ORF Transcript_46063/g.108566 Transcript_46063/m.108566 type:complete len:184 (-) Transcript_46063:82-633(-)